MVSGEGGGQGGGRLEVSGKGGGQGGARGLKAAGEWGGIGEGRRAGGCSVKGGGRGGRLWREAWRWGTFGHLGVWVKRAAWEGQGEAGQQKGSITQHPS